MSRFVDHAEGGFGWRERAGSGPVLVALHGIGSQARAFDALAEQLQGWRIIAWETPGYGASDPLSQDWPQGRDYADALFRFVMQQKLDRFFLLGHSLGTLVGAAFANMHPERLLGLILASCAQGGGIAPGSDLPDAYAFRLRDLQNEGPVAFASARAPRLIYQPELNPVLVDAVAAGMARVRMPGYKQAVRFLASGDLARDCTTLQVRTAVVVGTEDIVTAPEQSVRAHGCLGPTTQGALVQVPEAGHALPQQAPDVLARVIEIHARDCRTHQENCT
jgi:pimeloyl-ACP methyl ester carboxylesterase